MSALLLRVVCALAAIVLALAGVHVTLATAAGLEFAVLSVLAAATVRTVRRDGWKVIPEGGIHV